MKLALILAFALSIIGCTTTTTTHPDGSSTTVRSQDPAVAAAIAQAVSEAATKAALSALKEEELRNDGRP